MKKKAIKDNPLVSVITPVFNSIKYLEICIQSVLSQSYPYIEHVFVDGGSSDGTLDLLASYRARYPDRIRFISEPDKGHGDAWNKGWKMAGGDVFGWLGSDDAYEPDAVMMIVEFFRSNPDAYFVHGNCNVINESGEVIRKIQARDFDLKVALSDSIHGATPSMFYKREVIEKVGAVDPAIIASDFDFCVKAVKSFKIYRIEKVLSNFRMHKHSTSGLEGINRIYRREHFRIIRRHGGRILSFYSIRYFTLEVVDWLRPVLGPVYPFAYNIYDGLRRRIKLIDVLLDKIFPRLN